MRKWVATVVLAVVLATAPSANAGSGVPIIAVMEMGAAPLKQRGEEPLPHPPEKRQFTGAGDIRDAIVGVS